MALLLDVLSWACIAGGAAFAIIGAVGILRLPDVFARMHGAGVVETLGAGLILVGLMLQAGLSLITIKLVLIVAFLLFTNPTTTHALARAALNGGVNPLIEPKEKSGGGRSEV
ncbi:MAG: monovalent cation/H(+) antiporter subunit G [Rhodospirillales bacterium]